jgi:hypothetical protein
MRRKEYMRIPIGDIPQTIIEQYNLLPLVSNGYVYVEIGKGMYGLPQAGKIANDRLVKHLAKHGYKQAQHTHGLFTHKTNGVVFTLVVDNFGVKYVGRENDEHLMDLLRKIYSITADWTGSKHIGLTLKWDYEARTCDLSMPDYIGKALQRFEVPTPTRAQHSPHAWLAPVYGTGPQLTKPIDDSTPLDKKGLTRLQQVIGTTLYYARAVDNTMLVSLGTLASKQSAATEATSAATMQLLNYCATHPDAVVRFHASGMQLAINSDASYLSESEARSRVAGYHFLTDAPLNPDKAPEPNDVPPPFNGPVHILSEIATPVLASAAEAEFAGLYRNGQEGRTLRTTLIEMGHPQLPTRIKTKNRQQHSSRHRQ